MNALCSTSTSAVRLCSTTGRPPPCALLPAAPGHVAALGRQHAGAGAAGDCEPAGVWRGSTTLSVTIPKPSPPAGCKQCLFWAMWLTYWTTTPQLQQPQRQQAQHHMHGGGSSWQMQHPSASHAQRSYPVGVVAVGWARLLLSCAGWQTWAKRLLSCRQEAQGTMGSCLVVFVRVVLGVRCGQRGYLS